MYKLGDKVILQDLYFEEYNNKEFIIIDFVQNETGSKTYKVQRNGFDVIWISENNIMVNRY